MTSFQLERGWWLSIVAAWVRGKVQDYYIPFSTTFLGFFNDTMTTLVWRPFSRTTWISWYQIVSILEFTGAKDDGSSSSQIVTTDKPKPNFLQAGCLYCCPTNSVRALKGLHFPELEILLWKFHSLPGLHTLYINCRLFTSAKHSITNCTASSITSSACLFVGLFVCQTTPNCVIHSIII